MRFCRFTGQLAFTLFSICALGSCGSEVGRETETPVAKLQSIGSLGEVLRSGDAAGKNLVLITLDTVRQDRLGCYGYSKAETPVIDGLATNGVVFSNAVTSVPITLPSHSTILTGLSPLNHGVHDNGAFRLADSHTTMAESLKGAGYQTAAFVGCFVLDARFGLDQGFDTYDFQVDQDGFRPRMPDFNERDARSVTDAATRWLDEHVSADGERPFFIWVHYFDPHLPYSSPLAGQKRFNGRPYDAEIAFVDSQIGRFLRAVDRLGHTDRTVIVLASDHGEALGDHGESTHGMLLYESTVRVPLIVAAPGLIDGSYVVDRQVVGLVDLRSTVEDLLGLEPAVDSDGSSLIRAGEGDARSIYLETHMPYTLAGWSPLRGFRQRSEKYIQAPQAELYDLAADRSELDNLLIAEPGLGAGYADRLAELLDTDADTASLRVVDDTERARLEALGYVQRDAQAPVLESELADPKEMMPILALSERAESLYAHGHFEDAADAAGRVVEACPDCVLGLRVLAFSKMKLGRGEEAVQILRGAVDRGAGVFIVRSLAQALIMETKYSDAETIIDLYESIAGDDGRAPLLRGDVYDRQGKVDAAIEQYRRAIELDPVRTGPIAEGRINRIRGRS